MEDLLIQDEILSLEEATSASSHPWISWVAQQWVHLPDLRSESRHKMLLPNLPPPVTDNTHVFCVLVTGTHP